MTARELERKLKKANPDFRFFPGKNRGSGLYVRHRDPDDPDTVNLKFLCGIPSPRWTNVVPKYNTLDREGKWARGLKSIVRSLAKERDGQGRRLISMASLRGICPGFDLGTTGLTPQDQTHIRKYHSDRADRVKKLAALGAKAGAMRKMEPDQLGVIEKEEDNRGFE